MEFEIFEWDTDKSHSNIEKHGIDFADATTVFERPHFIKPSEHQSEHRWLAIGEMAGHVICVVYTLRGQTCRIISARRARKGEAHEYRAQIERRNS